MNTEDIYKIKKTSSDYYKKQHFKEALDSYSDLVKQYSSKKECENSVECCKAIFRQGVCLFFMNDFDRASESFRRFDDIYTNNNLNNESLFAKNSAFLSYCWIRSAKNDNDLQCGFEKATKAREIFEKNKISDDDENAVLFSSLGMYYFRKGDYDSAKKELERAEHFIKKHQHKKNLVNMYDLYYLAQIYLKENRTDDAINKFTESHNLSEELKQGDSEFHITCLENITNLYYKLERDDIAKKFEKKLQDFKQSKQ